MPYNYTAQVIICGVKINNLKTYIPIQTTDPEDFDNYGWFLYHIREHKVKYTTNKKEAQEWAENINIGATIFNGGVEIPITEVDYFNEPTITITNSKIFYTPYQQRQLRIYGAGVYNPQMGDWW